MDGNDRRMIRSCGKSQGRRARQAQQSPKVAAWAQGGEQKQTAVGRTEEIGPWMERYVYLRRPRQIPYRSP